jgi:leucyl/phenylalanyl-tRNA--protein transferase
MSARDSSLVLTPEIVLRAYAAGIFPMAENRESAELFWVDPEYRGIIPLDGFHVPRRLRKAVRQRDFEIRLNTDFAGVIAACAASGKGRRDTWINDEIVRLYTGLFDIGHCHTVECWRDGQLVGGLYGVALAGAFFGESMFSRATDASKVALVHLVALLRAGGFKLLDAQFITDHLRQFGAFEVPRPRYHQFLDAALKAEGTFYSGLSPDALSSLAGEFLQSTTQTSSTGCSSAEMAGELANIQPRKMPTRGSPGRFSYMSRKAALSGVSSGGFF